jgi:hypothetical protein
MSRITIGTRNRGFLIPLFAAAALSMALVACDGEDRPGVEVINENSSGTGSASGSATGTGSVTGTDVEPGVVQSPPSGATQVAVTLDEWRVAPDRSTAPAGAVYFLADNVGDDPHELVVVRTDLAPDALPVEEGAVPEDEVDIVDEIEPFAPGSKASAVFNLTPGKYVLFCNIAEEENGELESHYELGMRTGFTVQ